MGKNIAYGFCYEHFKEILRFAKTKFRFCLFSEASEVLEEHAAAQTTMGCKLFLRHDIDISLERAVAMAEIENELEIEATYMAMADSKLYGLNDSNSIDALSKIRRMGHEIGLHICLPQDSKVDFVKKSIIPACEKLEDAIGSPVLSFAFHKTGRAEDPKNRLYGMPLKIFDKVNAYAAKLTGFTQKPTPSLKRYFSDSSGCFREPPLEKLKNYNEPLLQLLIHPIWWGHYQESRHNLFAFFEEKVQEHREELRSKIKEAINVDVKLCPLVWNQTHRPS